MRLVLAQKDREISLLRRGFVDLSKPAGIAAAPREEEDVFENLWQAWRLAGQVNQCRAALSQVRSDLYAIYHTLAAEWERTEMYSKAAVERAEEAVKFKARAEKAEAEVKGLKEQTKEWESFRNVFESLTYHHEGMGCGIEDRGITDRYVACEYGWDRAMERVAENIPETRAALACQKHDYNGQSDPDTSADGKVSEPS